MGILVFIIDLGFNVLTLRTFKSNVLFTPRPFVMQLKTATKRPHHRECAFTSGNGTIPLRPHKTQFNSCLGTISHPVPSQTDTKQARPAGLSLSAPADIRLNQSHCEGDTARNNQRGQKPKAAPQIVPHALEFIRGFRVNICFTRCGNMMPVRLSSQYGVFTPGRYSHVPGFSRHNRRIVMRRLVS
jgi:hypothetical protein